MPARRRRCIRQPQPERRTAPPGCRWRSARPTLQASRAGRAGARRQRALLSGQQRFHRTGAVDVSLMSAKVSPVCASISRAIRDRAARAGAAIALRARRRVRGQRSGLAATITPPGDWRARASGQMAQLAPLSALSSMGTGSIEQPDRAREPARPPTGSQYAGHVRIEHVLCGKVHSRSAARSSTTGRGEPERAHQTWQRACCAFQRTTSA